MIPLLPFQKKEDSPPTVPFAPPGIPPLQIPSATQFDDLRLNEPMVASPIDMSSEEGQTPKNKGKLPVTVETMPVQPHGDGISRQYSPKILGECSLIQFSMAFPENNFVHLGPTVLPGPEAQSLKTDVGIQSDLEPISSAPQTNNDTTNSRRDSCPQPNPHLRHYSYEAPLAADPSQDYSDTDSKVLEYHLASVLGTVLRIQEISNSTEIFTPRAQNILTAINAVVSRESSGSSPTRNRRCSCEPRYSHSHLW